MKARRRVSRTFLAWLIPFLVAAFLLAGALIALLQYHSLSVELADKADRSVRLASVLLAKPLWDLDAPQINQSLDALTLDPEITAVRVVCLPEANLAFSKNTQKLPAGLLSQRMAITQPGQKTNVIGEVTLYLNRDLMVRRIRDSILALAAVMVLAMATVVLLTGLVQRRLVTRPIESLVRGIALNSDVSTFHPLVVGTDDEIGYLANAFNALMRTLKDQTRHREELRLAKEIQTVLLPRQPVIPGYEIAASLTPVDEVGGDYYDIISAGGRDWIVVGDVSGHGLTAGLVMMMAQTAIHTVLLTFPAIPAADLLAMVNRAIYQNIQRMDEPTHMTIVAMTCGPDGRFAFAGLHEDILLRRARTGRVERIQTHGMWIGLEAEIAGLLQEETLALEPGDCLLLYTDGMTESRGEGGALFGDQRLAELLQAVGDQPVDGIHGQLLRALAGYERKDDVTMLVIKRNP